MQSRGGRPAAAMDAVLLLLASACLLAGVLLHLFYRRRYSHWRRRGVPGAEPSFPFGNYGAVAGGRANFLQVTNSLAAAHRGVGYCGAFRWHKPVLLVWEPELVRQVLSADFASFHDRGPPADRGDPMSQTLFNMDGQRWRNLRSRLTPAFSSAKVRGMLPLMLDVARELVSQTALEAERSPQHEVDMGRLLSHFATDVIGSVAFGIQCNTLRDHDNEFLAMSKRPFQQTLRRLVRHALIAIHPRLGALLPFKRIFPDVHTFFIDLMKDTVEQRERHKVVRKDFVQLMLQARSAELADADDPEHHIELTPEVMAAQGFNFFSAGLDTFANTVGFTLNRLAGDEELQDRVAAEVRRVAGDEHAAGELSYDALQGMDLVKRVVLEGLRLWSPQDVLVRRCNATTRVGDLTVEEGREVLVVASVNNTDEDIFPEPARFDPDRHTAENRKRRHPYAFLPFGEGPRACIAERFALLEMQLALAVLVRAFRFSPGPRYEREVQLDTKTIFHSPKNGFPLKVEVRHFDK
ncbi:Cytochrome P450 CYP6 [Frankliniella occidentalis]|uniref:Probable cytochrome P450 6a13 n=1 Tax=Frankliniella occidentalis TaxID=133901 RepID=A0A6J1TC26_FRAOC|nr:probable cytochrome P450 6a13 [Frankliniella occidentalis]KAE8748194.1 Cytochrome P450 CYP6 [Frankliniella occidentalis]